MEIIDEEMKLCCPACAATMAKDAIVCISCGFDRRTGRVIETYDENSSETPRPIVDKDAPLTFRILMPLIGPWYVRLLRIPETNVRRYGIFQVITGVVGCVTWLISFMVLIFAIEHAFPCAKNIAMPAAVPGPVREAVVQQLFAIPFFLLFFPVGWSLTMVAIGVFHATVGLPFVRLNDWWNSRPLWLQVVSLPVVLVATFAPFVLVVWLMISAMQLYKSLV